MSLLQLVKDTKRSTYVQVKLESDHSAYHIYTNGMNLVYALKENCMLPLWSLPQNGSAPLPVAQDAEEKIWPYAETIILCEGNSLLRYTPEEITKNDSIQLAKKLRQVILGPCLMGGKLALYSTTFDYHKKNRGSLRF